MLADFLQPFWEALFEKTGVFGIGIAAMMPVLAIGLLLLAIGLLFLILCLMVAVFLKIKESRLRKILKKAIAYEQDGCYEQAWVQMMHYMKKTKPTGEDQYRMGMLCLAGEKDGWELTDRNARPVFWLKQAAETYPLAAFQLAKQELENNFPGNLLESATAAGKLRKLSAEGIAEASAFLETFEREQKALVGAGIRREALLAVLGDGESLYNKASSLERINQLSDALKWYLLAAENGHAPSQRACAKIYKNGAAGIPKDSKTAIYWYEKAATGGDVDAAYVLASMYAVGEDCGQSYEQAAKWFEKAAEKGNAAAEYNVAVCYYRLADQRAKEKGLKTKLDRISDVRYFSLWQTAAAWEKKATEHGYQPGK